MALAGAAEVGMHGHSVTAVASHAEARQEAMAAATVVATGVDVDVATKATSLP